MSDDQLRVGEVIRGMIGDVNDTAFQDNAKVIFGRILEIDLRAAAIEIQELSPADRLRLMMTAKLLLALARPDTIDGITRKESR